MTSQPWESATAANLEWFSAARFGLFVHWGLYSVTAGQWKGRQVPYIGEWIQHEELIPCHEYAALAEGFTAAAFEPQQWVALARQAGMRYLVITAKHHEGFALWDSACDPFNAVTAGACGRDLIAELAAACRDGGIKLGLYYSHCVDWREPDAGTLLGDEKNLDRAPGHGRMWGNDWDFPPGDAAGFERYLRRKVEPQLSELLTGYGDVALIWFDTPTANLQPEQARRLRDLIKSHQPGCLVGGRIGHGFQDFDCLGDNEVPRRPLTRVGETCMTLNDTWGYKEHDHQWAEPSEVVDLLAACTARNANLLLNVGPRADGSLPEAAIARLTAVGRWMARHGAAIHGARAADVPFDIHTGHLTRVGDRLHLLVPAEHGTTLEPFYLPEPTSPIRSLTSADGTPHYLLRHGPAGQGWLELTLPEEPEGMPRHIVLDVVSACADAPRWNLIPSENPLGVIQLPTTAGVRRGQDGWDGWTQAGEVITWKFQVADSGRFRVVVACGGDRYGTWNGNHLVDVTVGMQTWSGNLIRHAWIRGRRWQHYPAATCHLGEVALVAGEQELALSLQALVDSQHACILWLQLERLAATETVDR